MSWMRHFGFLMNNHSMYLEQESKEIIHVPSHPDYKQFLVWMKKLYDEGLMHPDSFTLNIDQRRAIASGPVPLVGTGNTNSPGLIASGLSQNAKSDDLGITENRRGEMDYAFMEPVAGPNNGRRLINASSLISINGHFALTTKCKYPEIAVRWVDYFFTDEGGAFLWAGKANQAYRLPSGQVGYAGGKLEWLKPDGTVAGGNEENDVRKFNTMQPGGRIPGLTPMLIENLDYNLYPIKKAVAEWASDAVPPFFFEDETIKSLASISADVDPYIQQFTANAIVGSVDIEKEWPVYLETLNKMKLATMVDIYQSAYDKAYK
jgi:putative aldouronate transport system substrate-binding protein